MQILTQEIFATNLNITLKWSLSWFYPCNKKNALQGTPHLVPRKLIGGDIRGVNP
jgi:hypothetical protein